MKPSTPGLFVIMAVFPVLAGCAVAFSTGDSEPPLPPIEKTVNVGKVPLDELQKGGVAFGGAVIRDGVEIHRYPDLPAPGLEFGHFDQTEFWSSNCEREFAENISNLTLTPFYQFDDFIEDDLLAEIWSQHAQGGHVSPETLAMVHDAGSGVRFLLLLRVEYDNISHDIEQTMTIFQDSKGGLGKVSAGGYDPDQKIASKRPTIKRTVGVSMALYDLESAQCVWKDGAYKDADRSVEPSTLNEYEGYQAKRIEGGQVEVVEDKEMPGAPEFNPVMDKCLDSLYTDFIREADPSRRRR